MTVRTNAYLKANFQNRDPQNFHDDMVDTYGNVRAENGVMIHVNSAANGGDDGNPGTDPLAPKLTIGGASGAISLCTDSDDVIDYIFVNGLPGDTFPITIDRARTNVIAYPAPGFYERIRLDARTAVEDVFVVASNWVLIQGFETRAGAGKAGVQVSTTNIHRCAFKNMYFAFGAYGVLLDGSAGGGHHVLDSYFQGALTANGIFSVAGYQLRYERNVFGKMTPVCINVTGTAGDGMILDNIFALAADVADGLAITLSAGVVQNWIIAGNRANYGESTMGQNPYRDISGGLVNHWMQNWRGNALVDPAVA